MSDKENYESENETDKRSTVSGDSDSISVIACSLVGKTLVDAIEQVEEYSLNHKSQTEMDIDEEANDYDKNEGFDIEHEYSSSEREAFELVDRALNSAVRHVQENLEKEMLNKKHKDVPPEYCKQPIVRLGKEVSTVPNVEWLTIRQFSVEAMKKKIEEFVSTWTLSDEWLHCIDYLGFQETRFDNRHRYRVRFSIPTRRKPIPYATASVYFTVAVSKIKAPDMKVDVLYVIETNRLIHKPGQYNFCELWLRRVIDSKNTVMKVIDF